MVLVVLGINHTTAKVSVREKVAFAPDQIAGALNSVCDLPPVLEATILSTCNRTELVLACEDSSELAEIQADIMEWLAHFHQVALEDIRECTYCYQQQNGLKHLMSVACGLDSMVLGEPQILGQMKSAYASAVDVGTAKSLLSKVFQYTFSTAKTVRTQTAIGANPVSVAYAAVNLSQHIFSSLAGKTALLIGAGETIELVARHLKEQGVSRMVVANRTLERGQALVESLEGRAVLLTDIPDELAKVDIVISSTASQLPILGKGMVERALKKRKHKPIFMVDIAVPRDIEPEVGELADIYLYTVDDLTGIIDENRKAREAEAVKAEDLIGHAAHEFEKQLRSRDVVATLKAYREQAESIRDEEVKKALKQLENGTRPEEILHVLARGITNKLIHTPCTQMKQAAADGRTDVIDWTHELLGLERDADENK